ncbi:HYC_CC_PP family protein [Thermophagus sp. OGC60D27]|uniref:HYC_CC_PP family protein n=1 Tax=Thermophagus sp. OGC60D27 TaxID=3458415 RepID=UPI0040376EA4
MLRAVTNMVITFLLLISTTGLAVSKHYCGQQLKSVELKPVVAACCDEGSCCHTETQFFRVDDDFLMGHTTGEPENFHFTDIVLPSPIDVVKPFATLSTDTSINYSDPPPLVTTLRRLALVQTYLL